MNKRAVILSAHLALIQKGVVSASRMHTSVAKALPSYEEYVSFHPLLADLDQMKRYLGEHSPSYVHLVDTRESLFGEYDSLASTSTKFASHVSLEDYLSCRIAVQSRAFEISNIPRSEIPSKEREYYQQSIGIDFSSVVSIEPINDWLNSHTNNNVKIGGYDAQKRTGQAWATKAIPKGQELVNNYGDNFYDHVLFR